MRSECKGRKMEEFTIPDEVRDLLPGVGGSIILGISPDRADGLSDAEMAALERFGPGFFSILEGRQLPEGFAQHFKDDVLKDMKLIRNDPHVRDIVRKELFRYLNDPKLRDTLYTRGGPTFSEILESNARHAHEGMFRTPARPGEMEKATRAGKNRKR
jgi:hypothetical protein